MMECNPQTKVRMQVLQDWISRVKSPVFGNDVSKILEHIASTMELITNQEETYDSLIKDIFDVLLTALNIQYY